MTQKRFFTFIMGLLAIFTLSGCELSLAQDVTPPPNYQRVSLERPSADAVFVTPSVSPNLAAGAAIFANSCAPCHGEVGMGGGTQADMLPKQPPNIGSAAIAGLASPVDWFAMVTLGKIDALMPPFGDELSVQQRWDVLAYVYSLSGSDDVLASILPEGLEIVNEPLSTEAVSEAPADALETETPTPPSTPEATAEGTASAVATDSGETAQDGEGPGDQRPLGRIFGSVTHGGGMALPQDLEVTLLAFDGFTPAFERTTTVDEDGAYSFDEVELAADRVFLTTVAYQGMSYGSHFNFIAEGETELELPVTIYETTSDISSLVFSSVAVRIEFTRADFARLHFFFQVSNPTDLSVVPDETDGIVFSYHLPADAQDFAFEQDFIGNHFVVTEDGFGDTRSILAQSEDYTLAFSYDIPYQDEYSIDLPLQVPVDALFVFLPLDGPELKSDGFRDEGQTPVGEETYRVYSHAEVPAGEFSVQLNGRNPAAPPAIFGINLDTQLLVAVALLAVSLAIGALWYFRWRPAASGSMIDSRETIMDAIIALDVDFENGRISEDLYRKRRSGLKSRLAELLDS